jgi:hypothetical protein
LGLLYEFLSLKNEVNVPSKINIKNFLVAILKVTDEITGSGSGSGFVSLRYGSADPQHCNPVNPTFIYLVFVPILNTPEQLIDTFFEKNVELI